MMSIKDWVLSQIVSKSLASSSLLSVSDSILSDEPVDKRLDNQGSEQNSDMVPLPVSADLSCSSTDYPELQSNLSSQQENFNQSDCSINDKRLDPLGKVECLHIKFLRLLQRLGLPQNNLLVAKVLYRMQLAALIRAEESDLRRANLKSDRAKTIAAEQEASGQPNLDFALRILVLGKTGVGKSSTINSMLNEAKAITSAFRPSTQHVQEIVGAVNGVNLSFIDTPGLLPSSPNSVRRNRRILHSIKRFIRKSQPDIVLYFERLDFINMGYCDFPLLKLISEIFGPAIWFNTILVMTHASSALPEGPNGYPVTYDSYTRHCSDLVRHYIHQAVSDTKLENPVIFVENHLNPSIDNTVKGILPNGQVWKSQFLLLCVCSKILSDVNTLLEFEGSMHLGPSSNTKLPSLPHLLSSFLDHRVRLNLSEVDTEIDELSLLDMEDGDEYDQLPPIRILTRAQFENLTNPQKKDYLDELDYRETLYLKKQLKEESRRRKESKGGMASDDDSDNQREPSEAVLLPDMAVPPSFDSDSPVHRFRCLFSGDQWLVRPVLDPHGWDHDVGFDGINLETAMELRKNVFTYMAGQMSKDKQDFNIQSESAAAFLDSRGSTHTVGVDLQSAGKELICTVRSNTKLRSFKHNMTECGASMMSYANKYYLGAKVEDSILVGRRLKFGISGGQMRGAEQIAYGGRLEASLRGKDYPMREEKVSLTMKVVSFNKETVVSGNILSEFRLNRGTTMSINANLNSRKMGQVSVKVNSSEHMEIALVAVISLFRALFRRRPGSALENTPDEG